MEKIDKNSSGLLGDIIPEGLVSLIPVGIPITDPNHTTTLCVRHFCASSLPILVEGRRASVITG